MATSVTLSKLGIPAALNAGGADDSIPPSEGWTASVAPARARRRWLVGVAAASAGALFATWFATRSLPWFGPLLADTLRSVVGSEAVTRLEETAAGVEDRVQHVLSDGKVRSLADATPSELLVSVNTQQPSDARSSVARPSLPSSHKPRDIGPLHASTAGAEDGKWKTAPVRGTEDPVLHVTLVHPDPERSYAELFVFALDLSRVRVHAVAGSIEPKSVDPEPQVARPGVIPEADRGQLFAAFNGGFKAEHGHFGMMVDGAQLLAPKPSSCTFASNAEGGLAIQRWTALGNEASRFAWWRQTPGCMVEGGVLHPGLRAADSKNWGATLEGNTVIRRSAVGLSADGSTLLVGISNSTTARALATGMQHAGAVNVAQLDVNFSYPRFLLYRETDKSGGLTAVGAVKGQLYERDQYLGRPSTRDFFYVTLK